MATYHRVYQLDSIVFCWVVAGRDHNADGCIALLGTSRSNEPNRVDDMIQTGITISNSLSVVALLGGGGCQLHAAEGEAYAFMRNCTQQR